MRLLIVSKGLKLLIVWSWLGLRMSFSLVRCFWNISWGGNSSASCSATESVSLTQVWVNTTHLESCCVLFLLRLFNLGFDSVWGEMLEKLLWIQKVVFCELICQRPSLSSTVILLLQISTIFISFIAPTAERWNGKSLLILWLISHCVSSSPWWIICGSSLILDTFPFITQIIVIMILFILFKWFDICIPILILFLNSLMIRLLQQSVDLGHWPRWVLVALLDLRLVPFMLRESSRLLWLSHRSRWLWILRSRLRRSLSHIVRSRLQVVEWIWSLTTWGLVIFLIYFRHVDVLCCVVSLGRVQPWLAVSCVVNGRVFVLFWLFVRGLTIAKIEIKLAFSLHFLNFTGLGLVNFHILRLLQLVLAGIQPLSRRSFCWFLHNSYNWQKLA